MRKRALWIGLGVLAGLWLVPAVFVSLYDPGSPRAPATTEGPVAAVERALAKGESQFVLFSHGYAKHWTITKWEGEDEAAADKTRADYYVERGPLDRRAGTFRFTLFSGMNHARDLDGVRLFVTSVGDWSHRDDGDEGIWTQVAEATVRNPGAEEAALLCEAVVPASTTAYRLEEVRNGVPCCGFSQSMLTAPTVMGRVYDAIAWNPLFRWVPDLR